MQAVLLIRHLVLEHAQASIAARGLGVTSSDSVDEEVMMMRGRRRRVG